MTRRARLGATARFALGVILLVVVLFLAVFPTRTYLDQQDAIGNAGDRLSVLSKENDRLRQRIERLQSPDEIERIAREEYNLARRGEEVFVIIPSPLEAVRRHGRAQQAITTIRDAWGLPPAPGAEAPPS